MNKFSFAKIFVLFFLLLTAFPKEAHAEDFGYNIYNLGRESEQNIGTILDFVAGSCKSNIVRFWGFNGTLGVNGAEAISRVLSAGAGKGIKFIVSLEDYTHGLISQNPTTWYTSDYKNSYKPYVQDVVNQFKGRVFMWELVNEPVCENTPQCKEAMKNFMADMSTTIKNIDSVALISPGMKARGEGGDDIGGYYDQITALPNISANSCHYYSAGGETCQQARGVVKSMGKYFYVGEAGIEVPGCTTGACTNACSVDQLQGRVATINSDIASIGADAYLIWQFGIQQNGLLSCDPFTVFDNDPLCGGTGGPGLPQTPGGNQPQPTPVRCRDEVRGLASPGWWNIAEWNGSLPSYVKDVFGDLQSKYARVGIDWAQVEPSQGNFQYNRPQAPIDTIVNTYLSNGITPIAVFVAAPSWQDPSDANCQDPNKNVYCDIIHEDSFRNAVRNIISHFSGIKYWEFWNEPEQYQNNLRDPNEYQKWLNIFYDEAKAVNPSIKVAAGSDSANWFSPIAQTAKYDALVVHPYTGNSHEGPLDRGEVQQAASIIKSGATVWITEWGYNADEISESTQAEQLKQDISWLNSQSYVEFATFHLLVDEGSTRYGLMKSDFLTAGINGTRRLAYDVFKDLFACGYATSATSAACEQPLVANPEAGCYNCNFEGSASQSAPVPPGLLAGLCAIPVGGRICNFITSVAATLGINYNATIRVDDIKSPITEEHLVEWYGQVDDVSEEVPNTEEDTGYLAYFLNPLDWAIAQQRGSQYKNTTSRILYDTQVQSGQISAERGEGSTKAVYGTQNAVSVVECLLTASPEDPECESVTPDLISRTNKYLALMTEQKRNFSQNPPAIKLSDGVLLDRLEKDVSENFDTKTLLASVGGASLLAKENSTNENVLGFNTIFGFCPDKEDAPQQSLLCPNTISGRDIRLSGVISHDYFQTDATGAVSRGTCNTTHTINANGELESSSGDCSLGDTQRVSIAPRFDFATGTTLDGQLGAIPGVIKIYSIFMPPNFETADGKNIKKKNDGKVDFSITRVPGNASISRPLSVILRIIDAALHIDTNSVEGANVENGKKAECLSTITKTGWLRNPLEAQSIPDECLEKKGVKQDTIPGMCENGDGGVIYWNNATTTFNSPMNGSTGNVCGKIIIKDPDPEHGGIPRSPCSKATGRACGTVGTYIINKLNCSYAQASACVGREANETCGCAKTEVGRWNAPEGIYQTIIDLNLLKDTVYSISAKKLCYGALESPWFSTNTNSCVDMLMYNIPSNPCQNCNPVSGCSHGDPAHRDDDDTAEYCGVTDNCCDYDWARCGFGNAEEMGRIPCLFGVQSYAVLCGANMCPNGTDLIPPRLFDLSISDISCPSENVCFASAHTLNSSGVENRAFLGNTTDGINWVFKRATYMEGTETANLEIVPRIKFVSNATGWLVAKSEGSVRNVILKTVDSGNTWTRQAGELLEYSGSVRNYQSFDMLTDVLGVVGPSSAIVNTGILYTTNGGEGERCSWNPSKWCPTWLKQPVSSSIRDTNTFNSALDISFYSPDSLMMSANGHRMYEISNTNGAWNITGGIVSGCDGNGNLGSNMERVRMLSGSLGYAAGNRCPAKYDGGVWTKLSGFDNVSYLGLDAKESTQIFAAENGAVYVLHRGGAPEKIVLPNAGRLLSVEIIGDTVFVGGDRGKIYKSTDGGVTWAEVAALISQP